MWACLKSKRLWLKPRPLWTMLIFTPEESEHPNRFTCCTNIVLTMTLSCTFMTGMWTVWRGMVPAFQTSCASWSSLPGRPVMLCVLLITWKRLWSWSRSLSKGAINAPSTKQVRGRSRSPDFSLNIVCLHIVWSWLLCCVCFSLDALSSSVLQRISDLTGCTIQRRPIDCNRASNKFRSASNVCNNRWNTEWFDLNYMETVNSVWTKPSIKVIYFYNAFLKTDKTVAGALPTHPSPAGSHPSIRMASLCPEDGTLSCQSTTTFSPW